MIKSSTEILRAYAQIVAEGDLGSPYDVEEPNQEDFEPDDNNPAFNVSDEDENEIDLPDESMQQESMTDDPVTDIAADLDIDGAKLEAWLKSHNYEITPIGGLSNNKGNV